jgi:integrase
VIPFNPANGVKRPADKRRSLRLTAEEYGKLGRALTQAEAHGERWQAITGARLLILTGCRYGEIEKLRWSEVDHHGRSFRLEETKEGSSTRPIGSPAFQILTGIEQGDGCPYVLPGVRGDGPYGGLQDGWTRLAEHAGLPQITPHTLRHSYASVAADLGYSEATIAAMLGHAKGTVTSRYMHHLDSVLIAAADRVARTIESFMDEAANAAPEAEVSKAAP